MSVISKTVVNPNASELAIDLLRKASALAEVESWSEAESLYQESIAYFMQLGSEYIPLHAQACLQLAEAVEAQGRDGSHLRVLARVMLNSMEKKKDKPDPLR